MNPSLEGIRVLESRLDKKEYEDLTGVVLHSDEGQFPAHQGSVSDIYIGSKGEQKVAIKILRNERKGQETVTFRKYLAREAAIWHGLKHTNILPLLGLADNLGPDRNCQAFVSPYCDRGTSKDFICSNPPVEKRVPLILGVARGLEYLHGKKIVHGDLKPSNVLIGDDDRPLLCDFGRSKDLEQRGFTTKTTGNIRYQARELFKGDVNPNTSTDVCAFGLTAFELWTGVQPYARISNESAVIKHILIHNARQEQPHPPPPKAEILWPILAPCFSHDPSDRPAMPRVVRDLESCVPSISQP